MRYSIILFSLITTTISAQTWQRGIWFSVQMPITIKINWQWHKDTVYRAVGVSAIPNQFLYRTGVRYVFNRTWNTVCGIALFFARRSYTKTSDEFGNQFRTWQEANAQHHLSQTISVQNRLRTEQRWFGKITTSPSYFIYRIRYQIGLVTQLKTRRLYLH
ncbi:MAG: DUF2490 domain-containing protein [Chitinophagaceae bacterium]